MVAIVLLNYNKSKYTVDCINSILKTEGCTFQIIIVDNKSEPEEFKILQTIKGERIIIKRSETNRGYAGGINYALQCAKELKPEYYLIMNNDTILDKDAIKELVSTSKIFHDNCIVSGKVYNMEEPDTLQYIGQWCRNHKKLDFPPYVKGMSEKDIGQFDKEMEMDMLDDIFWLLPHEVFEKVGYYCDYFFLYGEQNDYALRAKKLGTKLIYTPNAKIWHYHHLSSSDSKMMSQKINYWSVYGALVLAYLHLSFWGFFKYYFGGLLKILVKIIVRYKTINYRIKYQPILLAYYYFTKWYMNKTANTGFNPYSGN